MALPQISIDDRTYQSLLAHQLRGLDGTVWSDHNPSDPGIALLELLTWLGEMALYQMDQIPPSRRAAFLNLVIDPPEPATVEVVFELQQPAIAAPPAVPEALIVPTGTRLATAFGPGADGRPTRIVYETLTDARLTRPLAAGPQPPVRATVTAREVTLVEGQPLGVSDGTPHQAFTLAPPRTTLQLAADEPAPVLLDFIHVGASYAPNPVITVGGVPWTVVGALRSPASRVDPNNDPLLPRHLMIDPGTNQVLFGDGRFGAVPPQGAEIRAEVYRVLRGPCAFVRAGQLEFLVDTIPGLTGSESLTHSHTDALGGSGFFAPATRERDGLDAYARRYRMVTAADIEEVVATELNPYLTALGTNDAIQRTAVRMNRRPPLADDGEVAGHVTLVMIAQIPAQIAAQGGGTQSLPAFLGSTTATRSQKQDAIALGPVLRQRIERLLDRHRLITTRLHLTVPTLVGLTVDLDVVLGADESLNGRRTEIEALIRGWLDVLSGGAEGSGWPVGRSLYPSELYALIEAAPGVDHVTRLTLGPGATSAGVVHIDASALPVLDTLSVRVSRL